MLNRREQAAVALLCCSLLVGSGVSVVDYYRQDAVADFHVIPGAVPCPPVRTSGQKTGRTAGSGAPAAAESAPSATVSSRQATEAPQFPLRVVVNKATAAEWESLPGIGPKLAARIVAFRDEHGAFASVQDLQQVRGIGPAIVARIEPLLQGPGMTATSDSSGPSAAAGEP